jgi:16S rRNA (uracil1498-N3)-methyltransferase
MTRRRFYATADSFNHERTSVQLSGDEARHLRSVLRLGPGDRVFVFDGIGNEFEGVVKEFGKETVRIDELRRVEPARPESPLRITLAVSLLKGDKFDLVVQKTTELGVAGIVPLETERADVRLRDERDTHKRVQRWQRIALEAAKQSGRALVPTICPPQALHSLSEDTGGMRLFFSERDGSSLAEVVAEETPSAVIAIVGPEGGWTDKEIAAAREMGYQIVTLGGRVLRAETAAIAVTVLLQHVFGDLR